MEVEEREFFKKLKKKRVKNRLFHDSERANNNRNKNKNKKTRRKKRELSY